MLRKSFLIAICIFSFSLSHLFADTIHLKNGNKVSGIIAKEDEETIEIRINIGAVVSFSKQDVEEIERGPNTEHARMKDAWEDEQSKREAEEIKKDLLEEERERTGLVEYKGEWVNLEQKERLQAASIVKEIDKGSGEKRFSYKGDKEERSSFAKRLLERGNWFIRETEHFSIFYRELSQGKIVSDKAEYYFEKISYDLGAEDEIKWDKKCRIYIVENVSKWKDFLEEIGFNAGLVGGFVPNYNEREMFLCAISDGYLAITFPHELTHLIFKEIANDRTIPLWLNEGLANYEASVTSVSNELLMKYIRGQKHILLGDLIRMVSYPAGKELRELFYAQSEKLVEFLITQYGRKKFRIFSELILEDRAFRDALFSAYRGDFKDIEDFNIRLVEYIVK
ncbi:peptidase MA family metallohydrolase [Candidatus Omnitrophota bacterium]